MFLVAMLLSLELRRGSANAYYLAYNMLNDHYQFFTPETWNKAHEPRHEHVLKFTSLYGSHQIYLCDTRQDQY